MKKGAQMSVAMNIDQSALDQKQLDRRAPQTPDGHTQEKDLFSDGPKLRIKSSTLRDF